MHLGAGLNLPRLWLHWCHGVQWFVDGSHFQLGCMRGLGSGRPFVQGAINVLKLNDLPSVPFIRPGGATWSMGTGVV